MNFSNISKKKLLLLGFIFVILLVIPLTVYLVQQQQETRSRANPTTTLEFVPASATAAVGGQVSFDVALTPGSNQVNFIKLVIKYDSTKLTATEDSFKVDPSTGLSVLQGPVVENDTISVSLNYSDPTKVIQCPDQNNCQPTKIGTVTFDALTPTEVATVVSFDSTQIQIRSIGQDAFNENVFLNGAPAEVEISGEGGLTPTPSVTPSEEPSPTPEEDLTPTPTEEPGAGSGTDNGVPVCESLTTDVTPSGEAPYTITFTAQGSDIDGTISKVTFNFGEGSVEDVTTGTGIGTASASASLAHTYNSGGEFAVSAQMTDDLGGISAEGECSATVTITGGLSSTPAGSVTPLPDTGPNETVVGLGVIGGILAMIGVLLFLAL